MGLMLGKVEADTMIIHDSFALPVEGTETRVNASMQAYEYMSKYMSGNNKHFSITCSLITLLSRSTKC